MYCISLYSYDMELKMESLLSEPFTESKVKVRKGKYYI